MPLYEVNFDGLVGPNHHHGGLAPGNLASIEHAYQVANPKAAALQGLRKMKLLASLGVKQAILPPHPRPNLQLLRNSGFSGTTAEILQSVHKSMPQLLMASYSAASMWVANAATVSSSADTLDQKVHFTPANLISNLHRQQEASFNSYLLKKIFADPGYFIHHKHLPNLPEFADEGAANHCRLQTVDGANAMNIFVFGRYAIDLSKPKPKKFVARQTDEAFREMITNHQLPKEKTLLVQQNPDAIDMGVFHNDVIAVSHRHCLFCHEKAFVDQSSLYEALEFILGDDFIIIEVAEKDIPLEIAVKSYLFNSQIVTTAEGKMALIAPIECYEIAVVKHYLEKMQADQRIPIETIHYVDCRESMHNGGGPACLRLRVLLNDRELAAVHPGVMFTDGLYHQLCEWVERHYREKLSIEDLTDVKLVEEIHNALQELEKILQLPGLYSDYV